MNFVSHAQNFEDVLLWRALKDIEKGRYLDVGAHDPVVDSVSLGFYDAGWRGIHVEPTPGSAERLRKARPDEKVIEAAVSTAQGPIPFYEVVGTGLSTGDSDIAQKHGQRGFECRETIVSCVTLENLLALEEEDFHWLKIDVEGMEADVLRSWGDSECRPWVLVVESTLPSTEEPSQHLWMDELLKRDYSEVYFDGLNRHFLHSAHSDLAERFAAPPNVFDAFRVSPSHFSTRAMVEELNSEIEAAKSDSARLAEEAASARNAVASTAQQLEQSRQHATELAAHLDRVRRERAEAIHALNQAYQQSRQAWEEAAATNERRVAAEAAHREQLAALWRERRQAEEHLRREARIAEEDLRREMRAAEQAHQERLDHQGRQARDNQQRLEQQIAEAHSRLGDRDAEIARLQELAARLRKAMTQADALISTVRRERESRWRWLPTILRGNRQSALSSALDQWRPPGAETSEPGGAPSPTRKAEANPNDMQTTEKRSALEPADSLSELLSWDGIDFIRCAYVTLLGREPDAEGETHNARFLGRGASKLELLWELRRSAEGSAHNLSIDGFDRELKARARQENVNLPGIRNPYLRADSIEELLSWDDVGFVRCAYVTVLGRQPDPEGEDYYTGRIRDGHSKLELLAQLRRSPEAPGHDPGIAGLDRLLRRAAWRRNPVFGWILAPLLPNEGDGIASRRFRAAQNDFGRLHFALERMNVGARLATIEGAVNRNSAQISALGQSIQTLPFDGSAGDRAPLNSSSRRRMLRTPSRCASLALMRVACTAA